MRNVHGFGPLARGELGEDVLEALLQAEEFFLRQDGLVIDEVAVALVGVDLRGGEARLDGGWIHESNIKQRVETNLSVA